MRVNLNSISTASELKRTHATSAQIQQAKSAWKELQSDPLASKHQVKRAQQEMGRIHRLLQNASPTAPKPFIPLLPLLHVVVPAPRPLTPRPTFHADDITEQVTEEISNCPIGEKNCLNTAIKICIATAEALDDLSRQLGPHERITTAKGVSRTVNSGFMLSRQPARREHDEYKVPDKVQISVH